MPWSQAMSEGFVLAATVAGDRLGARALPGLGGSLRAAVQGLVEPLRVLDGDGRRAAVERMSMSARRPLRDVPAGFPVRAAALLVPDLATEAARRVLHDAPTPRVGFRASPGLRRVLRAIAERRL